MPYYPPQTSYTAGTLGAIFLKFFEKIIDKIKKECFNVLKDGKMLKKSIIILFLFVMGIGNLLAETLTIQIENAVPGNGDILVGIYNDERSYPDIYFRGEKIIVTDRVMIITITDLPKGIYAVAVYQDKNGNEKLDKILGIPTEKYGLSNNTMMPNYKKNSFDFSNDITIIIKLR
jgi:uncharacterized protein (DUF2141 family)